MDILSHLPVELSQNILKYLPAQDLGSCGQVSTNWRSLVDCSVLWKDLCHKYGWDDTEFIENKRTHYPKNGIEGQNDSLWTLNKWAQNFHVHYHLPHCWERNVSRNYLLSPLDSPITAFSCDEHLLASGHADGSVSVLNVYRVPHLETSVACLLPRFKVLAVQLVGRHIVVLQSMLLQFYTKEGSSYRLVDAKSFEMGYSLIEVIPRSEKDINNFGEWYSIQVGKDKYTKEKMSATVMFKIVDNLVYVAVRDYQMIYVWSLEDGKRVNTIHIPNRTCKLRDFEFHEGYLYIIYASRNVRHITVYDTFNEKFIYELTTPECKTQKLIVGQYLIGVVISGSGSTSPGAIKVWDKSNGNDIGSRLTGLVSFKTVAEIYDLIAYCEGTTVYFWEPKTDSILKTISISETVAYLFPCPYKFILVIGNKSCFLWDWVNGNKLYRLFPQVVCTGDYRNLFYADRTMLLCKVDSCNIEMIAFC